MSRKLVHSFGHLAVGLHHLALIEKLWLWSPRARRKKLFSLREVTKVEVFLCTYFRDIFGSPGQEEPSWAKWVSPLNSSMKTTNFKPNLYFYHRIPLKLKMTLTVNLFRKYFGIIFTMIWSLSWMSSLVSLKVNCNRKCLGTLFTEKWLISWISSFVIFKMEWLWEYLRTLYTRIWFLSWMSTLLFL